MWHDKLISKHLFAIAGNTRLKIFLGWILCQYNYGNYKKLIIRGGMGYEWCSKASTFT